MRKAGSIWLAVATVCALGCGSSDDGGAATGGAAGSHGYMLDPVVR